MDNQIIPGRTCLTIHSGLWKLFGASVLAPSTTCSPYRSVIRELDKQRKALIITQNGEVRAVMQDVHSYEQIQETLTLLPAKDSSYSRNHA